MTFKKKPPPKKALAKLRDGATLLAPIRDIIDHAIRDGDNDPTLEDYEAIGGNVNNLKGDALDAYLDLQSSKQHRQINNNNIELQDTLNRISELLNARGFRTSLSVEDEKLEREATFFRIIQECQGKEEALKVDVAEYLELHITKARHQYEAMKEIEQWFQDLLGDKTMEQEFNDELAHIKLRHDDQLLGHQNVEEALGSVEKTVRKLRDIGSILILSSADGVGVFGGPPPDPDDTVTLLVPAESSSDVRFHFTVISDDEAMFKDMKVQLLAQQYLKGMIFYGSAAKHKNRAQKRKVIRLMMRQLEAIYNFITRLRNAYNAIEKESLGYKARVDELQMQKDQAYRDRERYKTQIDDAEIKLKKILDEKEAARNANILLEEKVRQAERETASQQPRQPTGKLNSKGAAPPAPAAAPAVEMVAPAKESQGKSSLPHVAGKVSVTSAVPVQPPPPPPPPPTTATDARSFQENLQEMDSQTFRPEIVKSMKRTVGKTAGKGKTAEDEEITDVANEEIQLLKQIGWSREHDSFTSRAIPTQQSLIGMSDVQVQPSLDGLTSDERAEFEDAKEQIATFERNTSLS
ncbi:hypothetical protein BV898_06725 [Hypsibius exemplaris]|uniref:Uncharacterized protein n=1 Tax=Hypsibius exemplaris TaxID=2072580 RepID=A0A1W0WVT8_HYPEX|nr:hypothetical protein BV898_06725 [Hypsibius exemplaris]